MGEQEGGEGEGEVSPLGEQPKGGTHWACCMDKVRLQQLVIGCPCLIIPALLLMAEGQEVELHSSGLLYGEGREGCARGVHTTPHMSVRQTDIRDNH